MNPKTYTNAGFVDKTLADAIKFLAKVIPCPIILQGHGKFWKKSPLLRYASGSIFPKKPCRTGHGIEKSQKFNHVRKG